jgi:hypothetical protein
MRWALRQFGLIGPIRRDPPSLWSVSTLLLISAGGLVLSLLTHAAAHGGWSWHRTGSTLFYVGLAAGLTKVDTTPRRTPLAVQARGPGCLCGDWPMTAFGHANPPQHARREEESETHNTGGVVQRPVPFAPRWCKDSAQVREYQECPSPTPPPHHHRSDPCEQEKHDGRRADSVVPEFRRPGQSDADQPEVDDRERQHGGRYLTEPGGHGTKYRSTPLGPRAFTVTSREDRPEIHEPLAGCHSVATLPEKRHGDWDFGVTAGFTVRQSRTRGVGRHCHAPTTSPRAVGATSGTQTPRSKLTRRTVDWRARCAPGPPPSGTGAWLPTGPADSASSLGCVR